MKTPDQIETLLWATFDAATDLGDGKGRLNRNKNDTEKGGKSNRKKYRDKVEELTRDNKWTQKGEDGVMVCAMKAGAAARLIANSQNQNTCTLEIFNLACDIIAQSQTIEAIQSGPQAQGIIC